MKIAIYVPSWPPGFMANGIVTYASYIVPALRALGHDIFILTHRKMTEEDDPYTIDLCRFESRASLWRRAASRIAPDLTPYWGATSSIISAIKHLLIEHAIDVLEMEETFGWCFALSRSNLLPVVVRLHGPWFLTGRFNNPNYSQVLGSRRELWEGKGIQHAHYVTSPAVEILAAVKAHYGLKLEASRVIANPVAPSDGSTVWDIETCNSNSFLFVGRFNALKGGDLVLRAFAELAASHPDVQLTFVGPDDGVRDANQRIVTFQEFIRGNIPERNRAKINFCGPMRHSEVMSCRRAHLATIIASQYEIAPYSVLESLSCGCPTIATGVGGIPEIIQDQRNGLIVPSQNATALANACQMLLKDHSLATQLGRRAWQSCRHRFDPTIIAQQTVDTYHKAIDVFKTHSKSRPD